MGDGPVRVVLRRARLHVLFVVVTYARSHQRTLGVTLLAVTGTPQSPAPRGSCSLPRHGHSLVTVICAPAEIRVLFRSVGGIRITVRRSVVNGHTSAEHIDFTEAFNNGEYLGHDVSWYLEHAVVRAATGSSTWITVTATSMSTSTGRRAPGARSSSCGTPPTPAGWHSRCPTGSNGWGTACTKPWRRQVQRTPMPSGRRPPTGGASPQGIRYRSLPSVRPMPGRPTTRCCETRRPDCSCSAT